MKPLSVAVVIFSIALGAFISSCKKEAPAPTPPPLTAQEIIARASECMEAVDSFHFKLEHSGGGTPIGMGLEIEEAEGDVKRPGRLQVTLLATLGGMFLQVKVITVGETTYMTNPLSQLWEPLPSQFSAVALFDPDTGIAAIMKGLTDLVKLEDEEVSGVPSYHLRGEIASDDLLPITGGTTIEGVEIAAEAWIGKEDFLMRQVRFEGKITEAEEEGIIRVLKLSQFNEEVTIELPQ